MKKGKDLNNTLRALTIAQLDSLQAILKSDKTIITSNEIVENCLHIGGKSLSALSSISRGEKPLVKKLGKASAREGYLWEFNDTDWNKAETKIIVDEIINDLKKGGYFSKK